MKRGCFIRRHLHAHNNAVNSMRGRKKKKCLHNPRTDIKIQPTRHNSSVSHGNRIWRSSSSTKWFHSARECVSLCRGQWQLDYRVSADLNEAFASSALDYATCIEKQGDRGWATLIPDATIRIPLRIPIVKHGDGHLKPALNANVYGVLHS